MSKLDQYYQLQDLTDSEILHDLCLEQEWAVMSAYTPPAYLSGSGLGNIMLNNRTLPWSFANSSGYSECGDTAIFGTRVSSVGSGSAFL